jgi:tRNA G10  N-methylase Trm11
MPNCQKIRPIHPFAARMAPEIAFEALDGLSKKSLVLDPMAGSGTVLRTISEQGYNGIGIDIDPLSILMSKAWTSKVNESKFLISSEKLLYAAKKIKLAEITLPWIDNDLETKNFIKFWFASSQIRELKKLSFLINACKGRYSPLLKIALSRLIVTKSKGASLAADVSHSRPHRIKDYNDFKVFEEFQVSCSKLAKVLNSADLQGNVKIKSGDARHLKFIKTSSIDSIITSPPYLNALDYMRGHKLSLVWLGYKIGDLATIRGGSVGAEKAPDINSDVNRAKRIVKYLRHIKSLPVRKQNMIYRYALDIDNIFKESSRVLKKNRNATFVIGNSSLKGVYIQNTKIAVEAAKYHGLKLLDCKEREIPHNKRYLPPPDKSKTSTLNARMKTESVLTFQKVK